MGTFAVKLLSGLVLVGSAAFASTGSDSEFAVSFGKGYALSDPHLVQWGHADLISASPDGENLLVLSRADRSRGFWLPPVLAQPRESAVHKHVFSVFDLGTGRIRPLAENTAASGRLGASVAWFGGNSGAFLVYAAKRELYVFGPQGPAQRVPFEDEVLGIAQRPGDASAVVLADDGESRSLWRLGPDGRALPIARLTVYATSISWQSAVGAFVASLPGDPDEPAEMFVPDTGELRRVSPPEYGAPQPDEVTAFTVESKQDVTTGWARVFVLRANAPERGYPDVIRLPYGLDGVEVLPSGRAIAFEVAGSLFVQKIVELSPRALQAAVQDRAMLEAKIVALALMMYANDHDDRLPGDETAWREAVYPYVMNPALLDRFVATFPLGRSMLESPAPAEEEIGFVSVPGGKAIAYLDGHVEWVPD